MRAMMIAAAMPSAAQTATPPVATTTGES